MTDFLRDTTDVDAGKDGRRPRSIQVTIVEIDVPFLTIVRLLLYAVVGSLPAVIVGYFLYGTIYALLTHGLPR